MTFTFRRLRETAASAIVFTVWGSSARQNLMALKMAMVVKAWRYGQGGFQVRVRGV